MVKKKQISEGEIHQFLFCFVKTITVTKSKSKFTDLTLFYAELSASTVFHCNGNFDIFESIASRGGWGRRPTNDLILKT